MKYCLYGGALDGESCRVGDEPPRGQLWVFDRPGVQVEDVLHPARGFQYVYDCQGQFISMDTKLGKAIYERSRVGKSPPNTGKR